MLFFQPVPAQTSAYSASFPGIYSEDDYLNAVAQRAAQNYALAHARVQEFERQPDHYHYYHPRHRQRHLGGLPRNRFAPASLDNFYYGFGPAPAQPASFSPVRGAVPYSVDVDEIAYRIWQEEGRQRALGRRLEVISRQEALAREREAQRQRAAAEAAAREQQARAVHAARVKARQARDQEVLFALLSQLGLAIASTQSASVAPQVNRQQVRICLHRQGNFGGLTRVFHQPPASFVHPAVPTVSAPTPSPARVDRKGKGKAIDVPVELTAPGSTTPISEKVPTLKEELETRLRFETDPDVQESLVMLYSDLFDAREPAHPVAGPSGHKNVSFEVPIAGPCSSTPASTVPVAAEEKIDTTAASVPTEKPGIDETKTEEHDGVRLHRTSALSPAVAAKLLKFYRARRTRKLSLAQIRDVEDALRKLEGAFEFPTQLDFVDRSPSPSPAGSDTESTLAYTTNNIPIHAYEHALNDLLTRLDAVESNGDLEVRGRRKEVVKEVERALEAMERRIEESRERSRGRSRRKSVGSQRSDASVTVTPYNMHTSGNLDEVDVAVTAEEGPVEVEVKEEQVEVPAEAEDAGTTAGDKTTCTMAEDAATRPEVSDLVSAVAGDSQPATNPTLLPVDVAELENSSSFVAVGVPDSGADTRAPYPSDEPIHGNPSPLIDDGDDLEHTIVIFSPPSSGAIPSLPTSTDEEESVSSKAEVSEQEHANAACPDIHFGAVAADTTLDSDAVIDCPIEPNDEADNAPLLLAGTPDATTRSESSTTDATFITATADSVPLSAIDDSATFFAAGTTTPSQLKLTQPPAPAPASDSQSTSDGGDETFLLSSTPLADEQPKHRRPSTSMGDDELEIIGKDELEAARNDSDWSEVESELDLEVV